jgi:hypothetical protein
MLKSLTSIWTLAFDWYLTCTSKNSANKWNSKELGFTQESRRPAIVVEEMSEDEGI